MKINTSIKTISILFVMICLLYSSAFAKLMPTWPIEVYFETEDVISTDNSLQYSLEFTPISPQCDMIEISVESFNGLVYFGDTYWKIPFDDLENYTKYVDILIPANDTSRIELTVKCDNHDYTIIRKFITVENRIEIMRGVLDVNQNGIIEPQFEDYIEIVTSEEIPENDSNDSLETEHINNDRMVDEPLYDGPLASFMTNYERKNYDKLSSTELELIYMRSFEQEPLKDKDREYYPIGELLFVRDRGEYKFRPIRDYTQKKEYYQNLQDSLLPVPQKGEYDVTIILSNSDDYDYVSSLIDVIAPTIRSDFYRAIINDKIFNKLTLKKIKFKIRKNQLQIKDKNRTPKTKDH